MELSKEGESGMFSRSFQQEDFGEDDDDEGEHFIISLEDNGDECELLDEFDGSLPSSNPVQEVGDPRYGSLHTPPTVPAQVGGLDQAILSAPEKSCSNWVEPLNTGVPCQGGTDASGSGQSDLPLPPPFCPQWEVAGGFESRPGGEGERNVVSRGGQTSSNPVSVVPVASAAAGRNRKDLETVQLDGGSGGIWSEAVFLSTNEGVSDRSMCTGESVNDQSREKNEIAMESSLHETQNSKLETLLPPSETVASSLGITPCVDSEGMKESATGKRSEDAVSFSQTANGKSEIELNLPTCVFENNVGASSCHGSGQCTCVMCYKGRGIVDWFPEPESQGDEGNLVTTSKKPEVASTIVKTESQKRSRKQNLSMVPQPDVVFRKTAGVANGQFQVKTRQLLSEPVQQKPVIISIPEACGSLLFKQNNTSQILMVPANSQTLTPSSDTTVNKNAHIVKSTNLPASTQERCFLLQTFPKSPNTELSGKGQPSLTKSSGQRPVKSGSSSKQYDVTSNCVINNVIPAWLTKNQNNAVGLSSVPGTHKPAQASKHPISNVVSLVPGKTVQGPNNTQYIQLSPQILPKPTSILTKAPKYTNPVCVPVSSHNIPLPPPLYCAPEKQASAGGQFIPVSKSILIGKPSSSLTTPSVLTSHATAPGAQVVIWKTASTGIAPLSSAVTCSNVLSENQFILAPSSGKANQHQTMYVTSTSKNSAVSLVSTSGKSVPQAPKKRDLSQPGKMIITLDHQKNSVESLQGSKVPKKATILGKRSLLKDSPYFGHSNNSSSAVVAGENVHQMTLVTTSLGQQGPKAVSSKHSELAKDSKTPEQNSLSSLLSLLNQSTQLSSTASTARSQKTTGQSPKKMELTQTLIQLIKSHLNSPTWGKDEQGLLQAVKGLVETTELQTSIKQKSGPAENEAGSGPGTLEQPQGNSSVCPIASRPPPTDLPQQSPSCNGGAEQVGQIKTIVPSPKPPSEGLPSSYIEDWVQQSRQYVASCKDLHKTSLLKDMHGSPYRSERDWTLLDKDSEKLKDTGKVPAVRRTSAPATDSSSCPVSQFNFDECPRETLILPCPKKPGSSKSRRISTLSLNSVQPSAGSASQVNTKKTPSASVIPGDKGLKLKIKLNEKVSTSLSAEAARKDRYEHQYSTSKVMGSSMRSESVSSDSKTKEVKEDAEKPTRGETAEEMFQRFQEQAMQQVFNAQFGVGHVGRSLRPMRTTMSFADKFPPTFVDQQKKKKPEEDKKEEGGKKKAKEGVPIKEGPKKVAEPLIGKENVMKKKASEGARRKKPPLAPEPSFERKLSLEDCPRLQQDNSVPWKKEIYCNNILAGHKVFVKFNIFENPMSEKFFLVPFFNLGGSRTQFDREDMGYISKAVAQVENEKRTCARHLCYYNRQGGKATFFRKADTSHALTEKEYRKYSFTLKGFYPEAPKRHQPVEEKWTVDSKIEIEIDRAEVEDEGDCNLENEVADGALSNDILDKNGESLRLSSPQETSSGLRVNHVSGSSQVALPCDAYSGGKHIPGGLALSEPIQASTFLPLGKEENRPCVHMPTPKTSESSSAWKDVEKSVAEEILVKDKEENSVSENVSEECAYTERLREMLLKENSSVSLEEATAVRENVPTLQYDSVLKGSSLSTCGIKFFPEIKLEKPDDGYEDSIIPFPCQSDGDTSSGVNNLDIQDTVRSSLGLQADIVHSPKASLVQEVPQVTIKQEPEDVGYLMATGAAGVSDSAIEPSAAVPQTEPVPYQTTVASEVMNSGDEVAKDSGNEVVKNFGGEVAKDSADEIAKNFGNEVAKDYGHEVVKDFGGEVAKDSGDGEAKDSGNEVIKDFGGEVANDSGKEVAKDVEDCGNNFKELDSLDLGNKLVEDVTAEEGKRTAAESEDNGADSSPKVNGGDESKKTPVMSESPLSSSSVSESSDVSSSSEVSSSDVEGSASNDEEDSEEETDKLMEMSSSALPLTDASLTDLTEIGQEKNPVQKKISSLVESLRQRLTQDKPPLPQWLVPDVNWKPESRKRKKKRTKQLEESDCTLLDTSVAAEASLSESLIPVCSTVTVSEPVSAVFSAPTISESSISTHSTSSVSEPVISICTTASISEPTVSFSFSSVSSPVPFSVSGNSAPDLTSSSQNCAVANASNSQPSISSSSPANPAAIIFPASEIQQKNNEEPPPGCSVSSDLTPSTPSSLVTHSSSVVTSEPTVSISSTAAANSLYTSSATTTKCSVLSLSTPSSLSPSAVETLPASLMSASGVSATLPSVTKESSMGRSHSSSPFQSSGSMLLPVMRPGECKTATPQIPQLNGKLIQTSRPESAQACSMQGTKTASLPSVEIKESLSLLVGDFAAAASEPHQNASEHGIHFSFGSDLQDSVKKEVEWDSKKTPAVVDIVSENYPTILEKTMKTEAVGVNIRAQGVSDGTEKVNSPLCLRSNMSTPVSDFDVDVGEDDSPEDALSFKPIVVTPDLHAASASEKEVPGSQEFELLASTDLGFSPASSRSESPLNGRIVQEQGAIASKNVEGQPKGFRFPFLQRKERKALKREKKTVQTKSTEKASIASYLCEKFAINIVPIMSSSKRPKMTSDDKPVSDKNAPLKAEPNNLPNNLPCVSKTPSLDQIFGTEVDKSLLNKLSVSDKQLDKSELSKKSKNGKTAQVARKGITGKRRRSQIKPEESPASYTWRQLSRQSSKGSNINRGEPTQSEFSDVVLHPCRVVLHRLEDMSLGPNGLPLEEIQIKQEIEDVVDSDTPSSSSKARRLLNKKKRKRGSTKQARKARPREKKDIVDYYASMLESLQRKAQLLEEETRRKEMEEEEKRRKEVEECKKEETLTDLEPAGKEMLNDLERSENGPVVVAQQKLGDLSTEASVDTEMRIDQEQTFEPSLRDNIGEPSSVVKNDVPVSDTATQREQTDEDVREENAAVQRPEIEPMDSTAPVTDKTPQEKNSVEDSGDVMEPVSSACCTGKISAFHEVAGSGERATTEGESGTEESNSADLSTEVAPPQRLSDAAEEQREDVSFSHEAEEENSVLGGGCCMPNGDHIRVEDKNHESESQADGQFSPVDVVVSALKVKDEQTSTVESHSILSGFEKKDVLLAGCDVEESGVGETKSGEISEAEEDFLLGDELGGEGLVAIPEEEVEKLLGLDSHERMDMLESLEMDDDDDEERPLMIDEGDVSDFMDISGASDKDSAAQKPSSEGGLSSDHEDSSLKEEPSVQTCSLSPPPKKSTEALLQVSPSWKRLLGAESLRQSRQEVEITVRKAEISEPKSEETLNKQASNNFRFKLKLPPGAVSKALRLSTEMKQVFGEEDAAEDVQGMAESVEGNEDGAATVLVPETEAESESSDKGDNLDNKAEDNRHVQPPIPKLKMKLDSAIQMVKNEFLKEGKTLGRKSARGSSKHSKDVVTTVPTDEEVQFQLDMQFYLGKDVGEGLCKVEPMVNGSGGTRGVSSSPSENLERETAVASKTEPLHQTRAQSCKDKKSIVEKESVRVTRSKRNSSGSGVAKEKGPSASPSVRSRKVKPSFKQIQSVSPDTKIDDVGQSEVAPEESVGIFSNAALFKTEDSSSKARQSSTLKPLSSKLADQLLKKNAFDIHRLKMKLNPLLKGTLGKMKKESPPLKGSLSQEGAGTDRLPSPSKVNGSTTKVKGSESAFQKSVSDLGRVMKQLREKRLTLKTMERSSPGDMQTSVGRCEEEGKVISKECAVSGSEAGSEVSSNPLLSIAVQSTSLPKINTAKLSSLLKSFKKPVVISPGLKESPRVAGDAGNVSREEGESVEERDAGASSDFHQTLKRKRGNKDLSWNESAGHNGTFKVPRVSAEGKSLAKDKEVESEEKGERSFFDCLPNLMPAVWEEA